MFFPVNLISIHAQVLFEQYHLHCVVKQPALHAREQEVVHGRPAGGLVPVDPGRDGLHAGEVDGETAGPRKAHNHEDEGLHPEGPVTEAPGGAALGPLAQGGALEEVGPGEAGGDERVDDEAVHGQEHAHDGRRHALVGLGADGAEARLRRQRHQRHEHELEQDGQRGGLGLRRREAPQALDESITNPLVSFFFFCFLAGGDSTGIMNGLQILTGSTT